MKRFLLFILPSLIVFSYGYAQSVGISEDASAPNPSAMLDVKSNTKGMLLPRTSTASRNAIVSPAKGLILYDTTTSNFWFHNGSAWTQLSGGGNGWSLTGNAGINPSTNFIGTTDNQPLRFRVNNTWAGEIHPTRTNVFLGLGAGNAATTGQSNAALGEHALNSITDGNFNVANGYYALAISTSGFSNTAIGAYALTSNVDGNKNTAIGRNALFANTSGSSNTASGADALLTNTTGSLNTANGYQALYSNTTGSGNTANGFQGLYSNTTGAQNTANGKSALNSNTTGIANTAIGFQALFSNTTGNSNTATGSNALVNNTTGISNTASGDHALYANTTGSSNSASGYQALYSNTSGFGNIANGEQALVSNTIGELNTALGYQALYSNTSGTDNISMGFLSLYSNTTGSNNKAYGDEALYSNTTGNGNIALGDNALYATTTGTSNVAVGNYGLQSNTSGDFNVAMGIDALQYNLTGSNNIAIGSNSGTGGPNGGILTNTIGIGNDGGFLNGASNQAIIGNASTVFIGGKVNWGVISDVRVKSNIKEEVKGLDFIMKLRPVTYNIMNNAISGLRKIKDTTNFAGKSDGEKITYTGFLAQEVEQAAITSGYNFSGYTKPATPDQFYTLRYAEFVVPLVKAMQEQQVIITNQQKQIDLLEKRLNILESKK